jgi:hypothetical protein
MNITERIEKYLSEQTPYPVPVSGVDATNPPKPKRGNIKRILKKLQNRGKNDAPRDGALQVSIHELKKKKKKKYLAKSSPVSGMEPGVGSTSSGTPGMKAG